MNLLLPQMFSLSTPDHLVSPLQSEAMTCVKAIEAAAEMGIRRVILESKLAPTGQCPHYWRL